MNLSCKCTVFTVINKKSVKVMNEMEIKKRINFVSDNDTKKSI